MQYRNIFYATARMHKSNNSLLVPHTPQSFLSCLKDANVLIVFVIISFLATPLARNFLEQSMLTHMLIQIPLLVVCGGWLAKFFTKKYSIITPYHLALPLLIISLTIAMFWMLPRSLDASLEHARYELLKFISLPLLLGVPFVLGWRSVGAITKSFVIANLLSMLVVLAWLYIEAPVRLCSYYLIDAQKLLGKSILCIILILSVSWLAQLFIEKPKVK